MKEKVIKAKTDLQVKLTTVRQAKQKKKQSEIN